MVDTVRSLAALQALLADNTSQDISPQDVRDFLVSVFGCVLIEEQILGVNTTTVSFTSIPAFYSDLQIVAQVRSTRAAAVDRAEIRFGTGGGAPDTGTNYDNIAWAITDAVDYSTTFPQIQFGQAGTSGLAERFGIPAAGQADADLFGTLEIMIPAYKATNQDTTWKGESGFAGDDTTAGEGGRWSTSNGRWRNTAAVDSIDLILTNGDWAAGSEFRLYGLGQG